MSTTPRERPILFSGPMIRAILAGNKTQTRRSVKPQPVHGWGPLSTPVLGYITSNRPKAGPFGVIVHRGLGSDFPEASLIACPYGAPGDRLWVRETCWLDDRQPTVAVMDADGAYRYAHDDPAYSKPAMVVDMDSIRSNPHWRKRPSIHMPRWANRILLQVTDVRVQRLLEITDADVEAEGAIASRRPDRFSVHSCIGVNGSVYLSPRGAFTGLWDAINGTGSAAQNPWVWAVSFSPLPMEN